MIYFFDITKKKLTLVKSIVYDYEPHLLQRSRDHKSVIAFKVKEKLVDKPSPENVKEQETKTSRPNFL